MMQSGHCPLYAANQTTKSQDKLFQSNLNGFSLVTVACG